MPIALFSQLEFLPLESDEYKQFLEQIHAGICD